MVHRADKESCRARGVARATKVTRFFHCRGATDPLANFFCATVHPRRTRVGRNTDRVDTTWVWVEGCDWTRRYATRRSFLHSFLAAAALPTEGGKRDKRTKGWTRYCVVSDDQRVFSRVNARGRVKKKRGRASPPSGLILPRVHHVEKRTRPA